MCQTRLRAIVRMRKSFVQRNPEQLLNERMPPGRSFITIPCSHFLSEDSKFCNHKRAFSSHSHFVSLQQEELATSTIPSSSSVQPSGCKRNLPTFAWLADSSDTGAVIAQSSVTQPLLGDFNPNKNQDEYLNGLFINEFDSCFEKDYCFDFDLDMSADICVKGNLAKNVAFWEYIKAPESVIDLIKFGYRIPFINTPKQAMFRNNKSSYLNQDFVSESILQLLRRGSAVEVSFTPHVVSPLSVAANSSGKLRLIIDLRCVNKHIFKENIRLDDWRSFENYLQPNSFVFKFDLKQGYHHVDIFPDYQTFLGFSWIFDGAVKFFVFTVLPFGMSSAPYAFTKLLRPLVKHWRSQGIKICVYLDDGIAIADSKPRAQLHSNNVKDTLAKAGFVANDVKSVWEPTKLLTWIGVSMDFNTNISFIPQNRIDSILNQTNTLLQKPYTTTRKLAQFAGKLLSTKYVLGNIVSLRSRYLYAVIEGRSSWDAVLNILNFPGAHLEILFWQNNIKSLNFRNIKESNRTLVNFSSDATATGVGAVLDNCFKAHRRFSVEETMKSSTWRELTAVLFSLKSFLPRVKSRRVMWKVDNYAASRIVHVGSRIHELHSIALEINSICRENDILLQVSWFPRAMNADADKLSKYTDVGDWQITPIFFAFFLLKMGPIYYRQICKFSKQEASTI